MGLMAHGSLVASRNMQALKGEINVHLHKWGIGIGKCYVSANNQPNKVKNERVLIATLDQMNEIKQCNKLQNVMGYGIMEVCKFVQVVMMVHFPKQRRSFNDQYNEGNER